jgi:hypothetical protein
MLALSWPAALLWAVGLYVGIPLLFVVVVALIVAGSR